MRDVFLVIAASCTALILESVCAAFINWILKPADVRRVTVLPLKGSCEDIEKRIRWQLFRCECEIFSKDNVLLLIDQQGDGELCEIARRLCQKRKNCRICKAEEIENIIGGDGVCKAVELVLY